MRSDGSTRRGFLRQATGAGLAAAAVLTHDAHLRAKAAVDRVADRDPEDVARDEAFWREIQLGFTLDRSIVNLNNGGVSPSPRVVHEAYKRYLDKFDEQETQIEKYQEDIKRLQGVEHTQQKSFEDFLAQLTVE